MNLQNVLDPRTICLELQAETKEGVFEELMDLLVRAGKVNDRMAALTAVREREQKMTTAIQHGIAIPHAKTDAVTELVTAVGIKRQGIDCDALDGKPSRIFIMTLSPMSRVGPHIQFLSAISHALDNPDVRQAVLDAGSPEEIIDILTSAR